jgi:hypothetical protein
VILEGFKRSRTQGFELAAEELKRIEEQTGGPLFPNEAGEEP